MYCDTRIGGCQQWYVGDPPPECSMRIPDDIRKCVVFLGYRNAAGDFKFAGTAFFLGRVTEDKILGFRYLVTARHVIDSIRSKGLQQVMLRTNRQDGTSEWFSTNADAWLGHPDGPSSDVSVMLLPNTFPWEQLDHRWYPIDGSATPDVIAKLSIGAGEEVFTIGLFHQHIGKRKNIPIVRVGNIAAMPEEPIPTSIGPIDAFLVESRSISGLSGSPVFTHLGPSRTVGGQVLVSPIPEGTFYLLGQVFGHFDERDDPDALVEDAAGGTKKINVGIAIVVPVMKILETLRQPRIANQEAKAEQKRREEKGPTPDSLGDADFTKADFEAALKKVSRKIEPKV
jgi:hypothetical protein